MQRVTVDEFAASPIGRFVAGTSYIHFCASPALWGVILWGKPDETQAVQLGRTLVLELTNVAPHVSIIDVRRIVGADPRAFAAAGAYMSRNRDALASQVHKLALVRPSGLDGASAAGAYEVLPRPYPVRVFEDNATALAWLGVATPAAILDDMYGEATGAPADVGALRALLATEVELSIGDAAKRLGLSERTLQRKLGDAGTTFTDEVADARVRAAMRLLVDTDAPLTEIAFDVGCSSLQSFSALFRRRTGESPSAFRTRNRTR